MRDLKDRTAFLILLLGASALTTAVQAQDLPPPTKTAPQAEADGPIIPDDAFEAAVPDLDEPAGAAPTPAPPPESETPADVQALPALEDGTAAEPLADAPVSDPALAEPLAPLATFDVTPPPADAGAEDAEPAPEIEYELALEGLEAIGLEGRFRGLSALEEGGGEAANVAMVTARAEEDEALAVRLLRAEGYYDAVADSIVEPLPEETGGVRVTLTVTPGEQYRLGTIEVTGTDEIVPTGLARQELALETGNPIVAADIQAAEAGVSLALPQQGYPFAEVQQRSILLSSEDEIGDYSLPIDLGPRASFGGFRTEGDLAFDADHAAVLARFERGELYDSRMVDDLREAMVATGLFNSVSTEPVATGEAAPDGTEYVDILVRQQAGPPRTISGEVGYGTGQGFRVEGAWTHRNLFPPEGALDLRAVAGTREQTVAAQFRRSNAGRRDRTVQLGASVSRQDYDAFEARTILLSGRISLDSTPIWQKRWTWAYGFEILGTSEDRFDFDLGRRVRDTYLIGALPAQLGFDSSDSLLDPTRGFRVTLRTSPEGSLQGGFSPYIRNLLEGSAYYPLSESLVIAGRARFGSIAGVDLDDIAPSRRLYAGGGGSVRGFGYQELGPKDPNGDPIGGRSLTEFALEARYRFGNFGIVPFIDAGQVYNDSTPGLSDLRYGVGIGGRFYTNFGPFRLDVATPLDRRPGESWLGVYVSIGQAF